MDTSREINQNKKDNLIKTVLTYLKDSKFKTVYINVYYVKPNDVVRVNKIVSGSKTHVGIIARDENIHESYEVMNMDVMERVVQVLNIIANSNLDLFKVALKYIVEINTISTKGEYKEFLLEC